VGHGNSPIRSDDDGPSTFHTDTQSLRVAKKLRDFRDPDATETYFTSLAQTRQKRSSFRLEETRARTHIQTGWKERGGVREMRRKESGRSERFEGGPANRPSKTRSHYEHVKKPARRNARAPDSFSLHIRQRRNVNKPQSSLYPSFLSIVPSRRHKITPHPHFFCLFSAFSVSFFFSAAHDGPPAPVHAAEVRSINARFLR